jgi:D-arabinose 1-dehydrogenase-like Zn-dependent alcohol dehydrogenase
LIAAAGSASVRALTVTFAPSRRARSSLASSTSTDIGFTEIAPVLCAGVTVYKGLKMTDTKPGDTVVIQSRH